MALAEPWHWLGHLVICGGIAAALATRAPPIAAAAAAMLVGLGIEVVQASPPREAAFDLLVDALGAMAGLAASGRADVGRALGVWLHPAAVVPVGLAGAFYAGTRDARASVTWVVVAVLCWLPAASAWAVGTRLGHFTDADLVDRRERPALFALACGSAALYALVARWEAPPPVVLLADGMLAGAVAITLVTTAGFKVSGHVAVPALLAAAVVPWSVRGPLLLLGVALLLSWARVRAGVHRPVEVAGAWLLALGALVAVV